jgi:hypothetical protein
MRDGMIIRRHLHPRSCLKSMRYVEHVDIGHAIVLLKPGNDVIRIQF